jgi:AsmA family protein
MSQSAQPPLQDRAGPERRSDPSSAARRARASVRRGFERIRQVRPPQFKKPSRKSLYWTAGILVALIAAVVAFLAWFDWNMLRGPIGRYASQRLHREVAIEGDLKVRLLTWSPSATVYGLRVGQPDWIGKGQMATFERVTVSMRLLPLLKGEVFLPLIHLEKPRLDFQRDAQGRANWKFSNAKSSAPPKIPPIQNFIINDGQLRYADYKRKLFVSGTLEARERRSGPYTEGFRLNGDGSINGNPFRLRVTGGPLINVDKDRPYPFNADIRAGATRATARGEIVKPFNFGLFRASVSLSGPDLADVYYLTGLALPNTPPYRISGRLSREDTLYRLQGISGRVGDSDLSGVMTVETKDERPRVDAELRSRMLDFDDLATIFGGAPDPRETASDVQKTIASELRAQQRLLPDAPLQVERLRAMDATLDYRAASVRSDRLPVRRAAVELELRNGLLDVDRFYFGLTSGEVAGSATINARGKIPVTDLDARLRGVSLQQFIRRPGPPVITGDVQARAKLRGAGDSVRRAMADADGTITAVVPRGQIRQGFAELLGPNVGRGLSLLLSKDPRQTPLRCAVADFGVTNGVARARTLVIDTGVVLANGKGTIDLNEERLNLELDGDSKHPELLKLWTPITLKGPLRSPKPGVKAEQVAAQGGLAAALGALLTPLAAILPFIDPGLADDADCQALVGSAASRGAPVSAARTTPGQSARR